jgi:hypothetical protein
VGGVSDKLVITVALQAAQYFVPHSFMASFVAIGGEKLRTQRPEAHPETEGPVYVYLQLLVGVHHWSPFCLSSVGSLKQMQCVLIMSTGRLLIHLSSVLCGWVLVLCAGSRCC